MGMPPGPRGATPLEGARQPLAWRGAVGEESWPRS